MIFLPRYINICSFSLVSLQSLTQFNNSVINLYFIYYKEMPYYEIEIRKQRS